MNSTARRLNELRTRVQGRLDPHILRRAESLDTVWKHVERCLEALGKQQGLPENENGLTERLLKELEGVPTYRPYHFQKEGLEDDHDGQSRRIDIVVHTRKDRRVVVNGVRVAGGARFLALEAKRLPTGKGRAREYLVSTKPPAAVPSSQSAGAAQDSAHDESGGVARFKLGLHAGDLTTVGMIGYVQRGEFDYWRTTINTWVDELIARSEPNFPWDENDRLVEVCSSPLLYQLRSNNLRVSDNQRLPMRHLWVLITDQFKAKPKRR